MLAFILIVALSGLLVGALGRLAIPGPNPMGIGATILVGIGGSLLGGLISRAIFGPDRNGPHFLLSIAGAALIVWILQRRRRPVI